MTETSRRARPARPRKEAAKPEASKQAVQKHPRKRRVGFTPELGETICARIAAGETWSRICGTRGMPSYAALYQWRDQHPDFGAALARAKDMAADARADEALDVAKGATAGTVQADKLRVSTLMWHAARAAPHRYGSKVEAVVGKTGVSAISVRIRAFTPVMREDGSVFAREILPDGSFLDHEG
ncbi:hypothetical protein [Phenylobacterium kunshanense]|nr:hypothetical protein [Phenylobacterium kunshanense]